MFSVTMAALPTTETTLSRRYIHKLVALIMLFISLLQCGIFRAFILYELCINDNTGGFVQVWHFIVVHDLQIICTHYEVLCCFSCAMIILLRSLGRSVISTEGRVIVMGHLAIEDLVVLLRRQLRVVVVVQHRRVLG